MKTVNLYWKASMQRRNHFLKFIFDFFLAFASWPRMLLEVFVRKNFGCRYFSLATAITIAVLLFLLGNAINHLFPHEPGTFDSYKQYRDYMDNRDNLFRTNFIAWYLFLIAFVWFAFKRNKESSFKKSVFGYDHYSLYDGDFHPFFLKTKFFGRYASEREIAIIYEPALFFIAGILLHLIGQSLGILLIVCSIFYSLGWSAAYHIGDNFVWDTLDEPRMNAAMEQDFGGLMDGPAINDVRYHFDKPSTEDMKRKFYEQTVVKSGAQSETILSFEDPSASQRADV